MFAARVRTANHTLRRISPVAHVTTPVGRAAEWGHANGSGTDARFVNPAGLALEPAAPGRLIVADTSNHSVRVIWIGTDATVTVGHLSGSVPPTGPVVGMHFHPGGVAVDSQGRILVADSDCSRFVRLLSDGTLQSYIIIDQFHIIMTAYHRTPDGWRREKPQNGQKTSINFFSTC